MTNSYYCPSCRKWQYSWYALSKDKHMRIKHGWCELCQKDITRKMSCMLKHKCKKDKRDCIFHLDTPLAALNNHKKADKHRWRKDIVIGTTYHDIKEQDIDRPCAKCGWNVNICEPHYKGSYIRDQKGVNKITYYEPPSKPLYEDYYDIEKPLKKDYKPGGKYNKSFGGVPGMELYVTDMNDYVRDLESFQDEIKNWKDEMSIHLYYRVEDYSGVNHYHPWCKNE